MRVTVQKQITRVTTSSGRTRITQRPQRVRVKAGMVGIPLQIIAGVEFALPAAYPLSGHRVVTSQDGELVYADNLTLAHARRPKWLTTSAASAGALASLLTFGEIIESSWNWIPDAPLFLGVNGALTQVPPSAPAYLVQMGIAITPTSVFFNPQMPIVQA